jgi:hypothetical protein
MITGARTTIARPSEKEPRRAHLPATAVMALPPRVSDITEICSALGSGRDDYHGVATGLAALTRSASVSGVPGRAGVAGGSCGTHAASENTIEYFIRILHLAALRHGNGASADRDRRQSG